MGTAESSLPRLRRDETVLLIVDVQEKLVPAMFEAESLVRNCATLAAATARLQLPIVVTEQYPERLGPTVEAVTAAIAGTAAPVAKMLFSACTPDVQAKLREEERPSVLVCGVEAHVCVMQSVLDLVEGGFNVFVAYDAVSSRQESNKRVGWERMLSSGAIPTSTESAIFELLREAGTPEFKAMLSLIK